MGHYRYDAYDVWLGSEQGMVGLGGKGGTLQIYDAYDVWLGSALGQVEG